MDFKEYHHEHRDDQQWVQLTSRVDNNDTIDLAVLEGLKKFDDLHDYEVIHFQPFDLVHKRIEASVKARDGRIFKVSKGKQLVIFVLPAHAQARHELSYEIQCR